MLKKAMRAALLTVACIIGGTIVASFAPDPHEQIKDGISAAAKACRDVGPQTEYERRVCAVVAP